MASKKKETQEKKHTKLSLEAKVYSFALKFYEEQLPDGIEALIDAIVQTNKLFYQILLICHSRDQVSNGIWAVSTEKKHFHLIFRCTNSKERIRIHQVLNWLHIKFRRGIDDKLLQNQAIETVNDFRNYALYLTHETPKAIKDNKAIYFIDEIISNLSLDEIKALRQGSLKIEDTPTRVSMAELAELDKQAFQLGYNLKCFTEWYNALPFSIRCHASMKTIEQSYNQGVEKRVDENQKVNRLCVYIMGDPNTGKTYASLKALTGKRVLTIGGGGSGKFDKLRPDHEAIIIDDDICPNLLNMSDNYIRQAYRRNKNNPYWTGRYFVVTSNLPFNVWLRMCGINVNSYSTKNHYDAMLSRFYICTLIPTPEGKLKLACVNVSDRGSIKEQEERRIMFEQFRQSFDETIAKYAPSDNRVDYSSTLNIEEAGCLAVLAK